MSITKDLDFIDGAINMLNAALLEKDVKLAETCITCIQNYLNAEHHPLGFFSAAYLFSGSKN